MKKYCVSSILFLLLLGCFACENTTPKEKDGQQIESPQNSNTQPTDDAQNPPEEEDEEVEKKEE